MGAADRDDWADTKLTSQHRAILRGKLVRKRGWRCQQCREVGTSFDLAEGFVSRGDARGWPRHKRILIFHEYNSLILCRSCHKEHGFDRDWAWQQACDEYGEKEVRDWYESLPWKGDEPPRRF